MGRYIDDILQPGEKVLYSTNAHWIFYWPAIVAWIVAAVLLVLSRATITDGIVLLCLAVQRRAADQRLLFAAILNLGCLWMTLLGPATEEELMQYLTGLLTRYQRPVAIKVVDQLPRTPSLKISRALVREHYFNGFNLDGQLDADDVAETATTGEPHDH